MLVVCIFALPAWADTKKLSSSELEKMLSPIALFPDSLLGNILTAAARPDEVIAADAWIAKNDNLSADEVMKKCEKEPWDPSVKALLLVPETLAQMCDNMEWTQKIGEAFVVQSDDVMTAIQVLRKRAQDSGSLQSTNEVVVKTDEHDNIIVGSTNSNVVVVPRYSPNVVYVKEERDDTALIVWSCLFVADIIYHACVWDWWGHRYWCGPGYGNCYYINNNFYGWGPRCPVPPGLCHPNPPPPHRPCHSPGYDRWRQDYGTRGGHPRNNSLTSQPTPRGSAQTRRVNEPIGNSLTSQPTPRGSAQTKANGANPEKVSGARGTSNAPKSAQTKKHLNNSGNSLVSSDKPQQSAQSRGSAQGKGSAQHRGSAQRPGNGSRLEAASRSAQGRQYSPQSMVSSSARQNNAELGSKPRSSAVRPSGSTGSAGRSVTSSSPTTYRGGSRQTKRNSSSHSVSGSRQSGNNSSRNFSSGSRQYSGGSRNFSSGSRGGGFSSGSRGGGFSGGSRGGGSRGAGGRRR